MNRTASTAIVLFLFLTAAGYPQDGRPIRAESASAKPLTSHGGSETAEAQPSIPELLADDSEFTISKQVDEVNLILSVTDKKGKFVDNLTADDLTLLDDHKSPERWNYFQARTNLPLTVVLAVDISSSVRDRLHFEQQAANAFLRHILRRETDEAAIVSFGSTVQEKSPAMTSDVKELDATVRSLQAGGETAMYDAIVLASRKLRATRRKGVVRHNHSHYRRCRYRQ